MNPNWNNRTLFHGDNLDFLRAMNSESVDLIATDPPFNKGRDFHATPESLASGAKFQDRWSWEKDVHQDWVDLIKDDYPKLMEAIESAKHAHSEGMGAFMWLHGGEIARDAKGAQGNRKHLPALRPNGFALSKGNHGRDLWVEELPKRDRVETYSFLRKQQGTSEATS